jgi:integrase
MGLGSFPTVSLAHARAKASAMRQQRQDGTDPLEARRARRSEARIEAARNRTFRQVAEEFVGRNETAWRNAKHRQQWRNTLATYVYPVFSDLPVAAIDTGLVVQVLDPIWQAKPETASRVRGRIEAVLDAAKVRGYRDGPNPAQWRGNLALLLPARGKVRKVEHFAALPFAELPAFMTDLRRREGMAARALEFAILTAARTGEVLGARWGEIGLNERTWTIPGERMKAGREHRVPLCDAAVGVLLEVRPLALLRDGTVAPDTPVFPGPRRALPLSGMAMLMLLRRMGRSDLTSHGFRSSFSDWCGERTGFARDVVELALAHSIESKTEAAYRRSDLLAKRRQLMIAWGRFCASPSAGTLVSLRASR